MTAKERLRIRCEKQKAWAKANPEKHRDNARAWRAKNAAHYKNYQKAYGKRKEVKARVAAYCKAHLEERRAANAKRRAQKKGAGGAYTGNEWRALRRLYGFRCLRCNKRKPLEADHVIPVSKGGSSDIENIQPLCKACNVSKHDKIMDYRRR